MKIGERICTLVPAAPHQNMRLLTGTVVDLPGYGLAVRWDGQTYAPDQASFNVGVPLSELPRLTAELERHNAAAAILRARHNSPADKCIRARAARHARDRAELRADGLPEHWNESTVAAFDQCMSEPD